MAEPIWRTRKFWVPVGLALVVVIVLAVIFVDDGSKPANTTLGALPAIAALSETA